MKGNEVCAEPDPYRCSNRVGGVARLAAGSSPGKERDKTSGK